MPSNSISPAVGLIKRSSVRASVDLPQPEFADDAERLAAVHLEAHAVDRAHRPLAAARREMLGEPRHAQQHGHGSGFQQAAS